MKKFTQSITFKTTTEQRDYIEVNGGSTFLRQLVDEHMGSDALDERINRAVADALKKMELAPSKEPEKRPVTEGTKSSVKEMFA